MANNNFIKNKKILIVDDDQDMLDSLQDLLYMHETVTTTSFEEAAAFIENHHIDLAVLDIMGVNGIRLLDMAIENNITAIMLSAHAYFTKDSVKAYDKGASYYVPKEKIVNIATYVSDVFEALINGKNPWDTWLERMEGLYDGKLVPDLKRKDVPRHSFFEEQKGEIPFQYTKLKSMSPISRAAFPHRHSFYTIFYINKGEGKHVIDFEPFSIQPGSLFIISPGNVHFWQITQPLEGNVIIFSEDFLFSFSQEENLISELDFFHDAVSSPQIILNPNQDESILQTIQFIENEYQSEAYRRKSMLQLYLRMIFIQIQRIINSGRTSLAKELPPIVNNFKKIVSENFLNQKAIPFYAKKLGVSESHLYDILNKTTGMTPGQIIHSEIVLEAKRQLAHTDLTISEICYKLNYQDPSYFSRLFKRETGLSPKIFRKSFREKYRFSDE